MCRTNTLSVSSEALAAFEKARTTITCETAMRLQHYACDIAQWDDQTVFGVANAMDLILRSLIGAMYLEEPALLDDQMVCVSKCLRDRGIPSSSLLRCLRFLAEAVELVMPPQYSFMVYPFINRMVAQQEAQLECYQRIIARSYGPPLRFPGNSKHSWHA